MAITGDERRLAILEHCQQEAVTIIKDESLNYRQVGVCRLLATFTAFLFEFLPPSSSPAYLRLLELLKTRVFDKNLRH